MEETQPTPGTAIVDPYFGRMNAPTAAAFVKGACGDEMEFYLYIVDGIIKEVRYYTDGCGYARGCARAVAQAATDAGVRDALGISPGAVLDQNPDLPDEGWHCAILAVTTLHRAVADYLLCP